MNPFKPSNIKERSQHLVDRWQKILSQEAIEGNLELDEWALKVDTKWIRVRKINGDLSMRNLGLNQIPEWIGQIEEVNGYFDCSHNQLTTLINSPQKVNYNFYCFLNQLSSLEGLSKLIGKDLFCYHNQKEFSMDDIPKDVKLYSYN